MAAFNASLSQEIETIFIDVDGENAKISSTLVREKFKKGESLLGYVPQEILPILND
jgi:phosphopantetheine adenylyltransferase